MTFTAKKITFFPTNTIFILYLEIRNAKNNRFSVEKPLNALKIVTFAVQKPQKQPKITQKISKNSQNT